MLQFHFSDSQHFTAEFAKKQVNDNLLENFANCLQAYSQKIESFQTDTKADEETYKRALETFLNDAFYKNRNAIDNQPYAQGSGADLAIFSGTNKAKSSISVLIEVKTPQNKAEMMTTENPNKKALQEAIHYYLWEKIEKENDEITHIIITNCIDFFVFKAEQFRKIFFDDGKLRKHFQEWRKGKKDDDRTQKMYSIIKQFIEESEEEIKGLHFSLPLSVSSQTTLLSLYHFFSPYSLLKEDIIFDANALNKPFYYELLYILGLEEYKDGEVVKIRRKTKPEAGALIELAIFELDINGKIENPALDEFGKDRTEKIENVALSLCILWLNRILFLKLLEAQLYAFNDSDKRFQFMNLENLPDFGEIKGFFFAVLARRPEERHHLYQEKFAHIPYLNSSLFEPDRTLEEKGLHIAELKNTVSLPIYKDTILRDTQGKQRSGEKIKTLPYLFDFLNVYNFGLIGEHIVNPTSNTIINASVLGKIFEKLNGYADGSFFTPSYITEYMCRELLHTCVLKRFSKVFDFQFDTIKELDTYIFKNKKQKQANEIINSLKICDPAVGSGHFLVSMLNQVLFLKYELGILYERNTDKLLKINLRLENDEVILEGDDYGEKVIYKLKDGKLPLKAQIIQETLFHEKQTIIENCLFGVDINRNSVKICQLRLWIELLKNAYYKPNSNLSGLKDLTGFLQLETLPNIDINIKTGNSVLSRFDLNVNIDKYFKKNINHSRAYYLECVTKYKKETNKELKKGYEKAIDTIKSGLKTFIFESDPRNAKLKNLQFELFMLDAPRVVALTEKEKKAEEKQRKELDKKVKELRQELENEANGITFPKAMEWRFEFPEVLDENGDFEGFDMMVANPPYIAIQTLRENIAYISKKYETYEQSGDIYMLFYELAHRLLKPESHYALVTSNKWMRANYGKTLRQFFKYKNNPLLLVDLSGTKVFDEATVDVNILLAENSKVSDNFALKASHLKPKFDFEKEDLGQYVANNQMLVSELTENSWVFTTDEIAKLRTKIKDKGTPLENLYQNWEMEINRGILTGFNEAFIIDNSTKERLCREDEKSIEILKPLLRGRDTKKYADDWQNLWLILSKSNVYKKIKGKKTLVESATDIPNDYPAIYKHLQQFENQLKTRQDIGDNWYNLRRCAYYDLFDKAKIIYPNMTKYMPFIYDESGFYTNQKCFILTGKHLEYLTGFFNSSLFKFTFKDDFPELQGGTRELSKVFFEKVAVYMPTEAQEAAISEKVEQILFLKKNNKEADTSNLEKEIDNLVYLLYGLGAEEIALIAKSAD